MNKRLDRLCQAFTEEIPGLIVSGAVNIGYLIEKPTLFDPEFPGILAVTPNSVVLLVDPRYTAQAKAADLPCRVEEYRQSAWATLALVVKQEEIKRMGFEARRLTVASWRRLQQELLIELVPTEGLVERLRSVKDESEVDKLGEAAALADEVFARVIKTIVPGCRERRIALEIDYELRKAGAIGPSFETIVASGPNSAFPHARATDRAVCAGDFIKIDFGANFEGYRSDMTRTVVLGPASERQKEMYQAVATAQTAALEGLAPGVGGREADALARECFASLGTAKNFSHNLGHGVGLEVHEQPTLGSKAEGSLEVGMVFTVEPGLYFPGFGGVRIEDMVVLREHGIQVLTKSPKDLIELSVYGG